MQRLRHPIRSITEPFGKAGLTVAICALVLAMVGGAYAAGGLTKSQEKQVKKIAKKYAGKPGAPGATGPAGANGKNGTNGKEGPQGEEGSPWTAGGTLPAGKAETGTWAMSELAQESESFKVYAPISFPIPLAAALDETHVHVIAEGEQGGAGAGCDGGTSSNPIAEPGNLCIYIRKSIGSGMTAHEVAENVLSVTPEVPTISLGSGKGGALLTTGPFAKGTFLSGDWIVRAPAGS